MTVMEILNIVAQANWRGDLYVLGDSVRVMSFDQGALKSARSDASDDRLGEVMFRNGVLTRDQLDEVLADPAPSKRFGEVCVERGFLDAGQLFAQLQKQAESIFFESLLTDLGHYAFVLPPEGEGESRATTFHLPIHGLLMEGVQRVDEMALFRDKIPHDGLCPKPVADAKEAKLDDGARRVLAACDGARSIADLARVTGLGEFLTTKAVYHLLQSKQVTLRSAPVVRPEQIVALVSRSNEVMQDIFVAIATYGGLAQSRATVQAWIERSGYGRYFGGGIDDFGGLDTKTAVAAMQAVESAEPVEELHQALHELVAFALFSATTTLPRDQERMLARDVNARLKTLRVA
jgi:hypothetical protein